MQELVSTAVLAILVDALLIVLRVWVTPWMPRGGGRGARTLVAKGAAR